MKVEITAFNSFADLIYEAFSGTEIILGSYMEGLINQTKAQAVSHYIKQTSAIPDEDDVLEVFAIHAEILANHIFNTFEKVFVENNECYAIREKTKTVIYKDMEDFNWFE